MVYNNNNNNNNDKNNNNNASENIGFKPRKPGGSIWPPPPSCNFFRNVTAKERVKPFCFFVAFNGIIIPIFAENLIEIPQVVQKKSRSKSLNFFKLLSHQNAIWILKLN